MIKAAMYLAQLALGQMAPCCASFWAVELHPRMSSFAHDGDNVITLAEQILQVVQLYTHPVHVLDTI